MKEITTIKLSKNTAELLNKLKIHPRQSYEEVVLKFASEGKKPKKIAYSPKPASHAPITTIKLSKKTIGMLSNLKIHPRQSYEEVILALISENEKRK